MNFAVKIILTVKKKIKKNLKMYAVTVFIDILSKMICQLEE